MSLYYRPVGSSKKEYVVLDAREVAPLTAQRDMFVNNTASPAEGKVIFFPLLVL